MKTLLSICLITVSFMLSAQDIESIAKGDILKGSGGLSLNQIYNNSNGRTPSRNPYTYVFTGNIDLKILGFINAPFNFIYSNLGNQYSQPNFNQTSIHPNYKWVSTHFGTIACAYSPYTVNGHLFKGTAIDLTPGRLSFSAFYGCFQKAVNPEGAVGGNAQPVYKRIGAGCKIGFRDDKLGTWGLVLFSAKDQMNSLPVLTVPESISPKQNWNSSIQVQRNFLKKISFNADFSLSMLTEDLRVKDKNTALPSFLQFNNTNASTSIYKAFKSGIIYTLGKSAINIAYERIDPFYKTLGAYYFNNDLENITAGFSTQLFRQKVMISANGGVQHDNLSKTKLSTMSRFVGNTNINIKPNAKFNFNINYSNFLSYTNVRPFTDYQNQLNPYLQWDTLNFRQISRSVTGNLMMVLHADSLYASTLTTSLTYQNAADKQGENTRNGSAFYNSSIGYAYQRIKTGEACVFSINAGRTKLNELQLFNLSPVVSISKPFFNKKLRPGLSLSYTNSYYDKKYSGAVVNLRGTLNYLVKKVHNFSFSFLILNRKDNPVSSLYTHHQRFTETTVSFMYAVNMEFFDLKKSIKKK